MAFCTKCGAEIENDAKFCALCGAPTENKTTAENVKEKFNEFNDTADTTNEFDPADIENNKIMAVLSYFGLLVLIPIFAAKESKFARFHANQGLVFFIADILFGIAVGLVAGIVSFILTLIGLGAVAVLLTGLISGAIGIISLVIVIIGIVNAASGKAKELPIIGKFKILN